MTNTPGGAEETLLSPDLRSKLNAPKPWTTWCNRQEGNLHFEAEVEKLAEAQRSGDTQETEK